MPEAGVLVVGSSGQVGRSLLHALAQAGCRATGTTRRASDGTALPLDLATLLSQGDAAAAIAKGGRGEPSAIYCLGGMTWVDGCERDPALARRINATGPTALAAYAADVGIPFAFVSTDYVFAGREQVPGPYAEDAKPEPLSVYGASKLAGEQGVAAAHRGAVIVRSTWVYGPDEQGKNNAYSVVRSLAAKRRLAVAVDQISNPTYNADLAAALVLLVNSGASGLFHVAGPDLMDRLEWARRIGASCGLDTSLLDGVTTAAMGLPAARPLHSGLRSSRLAAQLPGFHMRPLEEGLAAAHPLLMQAAAAEQQDPALR